MSADLKGLWFDADRQKWRVRLYKRGRAYYPSPCAYFDDENEAREAHAALKRKLDLLPSRRRANTDTDFLSLWRQCEDSNRSVTVTVSIPASRV